MLFPKKKVKENGRLLTFVNIVFVYFQEDDIVKYESAIAVGGNFCSCTVDTTTLNTAWIRSTLISSSSKASLSESRKSLELASSNPSFVYVDFPFPM